MSSKTKRKGAEKLIIVSWGGGIIAPHWLAHQNAERGKYHVFRASEMVFCTGMYSKNGLKHVLKRLFRGGASLSKIKLIN